METIPESDVPILVVDDDPALLHSMEAVIQSFGFPRPVLLSDSRRVLELMKTHCFQVVILDVIMPHINGLELIRPLKDICPQVQCVMITASDDPAGESEARRQGAFAYMVKPVNREMFQKIIAAAFEKRTDGS